MTTSREVSASAVQHAIERGNNPAEVWGYNWGIDGLNKATGGIVPGRMVVLISRPNVGKSALAGSLLTNVARQFFEGSDDKLVKMFTFEMSAEQIQHRLACQMARVPIRSIDTGY